MREYHWRNTRTRQGAFVIEQILVVHFFLELLGLGDEGVATLTGENHTGLRLLLFVAGSEALMPNV